MEKRIILKDVCKNYGKKTALDHISLTIENGMFGLLGPNGAGKTTLMKVLTSLQPKTSGEISMCGIPIEKTKKYEVSSGICLRISLCMER